MFEKHTNELFPKLCKKVGNALKKYSMLQHNDSILIGLSGGKDSLFLLESMADRIKHLPFRVKLMACHVHIREVGYKVDMQYLDNLCKQYDIPLYYEEMSANLTADPKKAPCFVCSWHRRKRLFELTKKLACNKLALGHHMDDALETLMMNMIYHGSISSLPAKLSMFDGRMQLIRPLIELTNKEMVEVACERQYPVLKEHCPYGDDTKRAEVRSLIDSMSNMHVHARKNVFRSMVNTFPEYLPALKRKSDED